MSSIQILIGSMLGAAEYVAEDLADTLRGAGHDVHLQNPAELAGLLRAPGSIWLICTSTHGAGDIPDNLQPFARALAEQRPDLSQQRYAVVALGNSDYDTFCQAGKTLDKQLQALGAQRIGDRLEIDVKVVEIPEDAAIAWAQALQPEL